MVYSLDIAPPFSSIDGLPITYAKPMHDCLFTMAFILHGIYMAIIQHNSELRANAAYLPQKPAYLPYDRSLHEYFYLSTKNRFTGTG